MVSDVREEWVQALEISPTDVLEEEGYSDSRSVVDVDLLALPSTGDRGRKIPDLSTSFLMRSVRRRTWSWVERRRGAGVSP
jgi:hypothetical protein